MEEELKELEATLESFYDEVDRRKSTFCPNTSKRFLEAYEEYELTTDSFLTVEQYVDFLVLHYVTDNWNNPAKFLWKRIPKAMKKEKDLVATWEIGQLLFTSKYLEAATKINEFKSGKLHAWLKVGYRYIMYKLIQKAYDNIDKETMKVLMGFKDSKEQKAYETHFEKEIKPNGKSVDIQYLYPLLCRTSGNL